MHVRPKVLAAAVAIASAALPAPAGVASAKAEPPPWLEVQDGTTQPVFAFEEAIAETVFVETRVDTDGDGRRDRARLLITRPAETESEGIDVPVVMGITPYWGPFGDAVNHPMDVDALPQEGRATSAGALARADIPGTLDDYYVPRGYAVVSASLVGTNESDGCPTVGDMSETIATRAIIDWLNGRATAVDASGQRVRADWTTGVVGMIGTSYDGTLANMVATTGVHGLKTIVPVAAISSWYDYYRANGLVVSPHSNRQALGDNFFLGEDTDVLAHFQGGDERMTGPCADELETLRSRQDRVTGDDNAFWHERDYVRRVGGVRSSVFVVHGLNDYNVKTKQFATWWRHLSAKDLPRKLWLHNRGHSFPAGPEFASTVHRWFDFWLHGVRNDVMKEPRVRVEHDDGTLDFAGHWPLPGTRAVPLHLGAEDAAAPGTLARRRQGGTVRQTFVDRGRELDTDEALLPGPDAANPNRLVYRTPELTSDVHLSGTPFVDLRASVLNRTAANLTAVLVDYGPAGSGEAPVMVTRGWMDVQNRFGPEDTVPIEPGGEYAFRFDLQPDDYVFRAGHRIGLVVVSTDHDFTFRPLPGTVLSVFAAKSRLTLPVVSASTGWWRQP